MASITCPWVRDVQEQSIWRYKVWETPRNSSVEGKQPRFQMPLALWPEISSNVRNETFSPTEDWQLVLDLFYFLSIFFYFPFISICCSCRQPKPFVLNKEQGYSRGFLAWNMADYEDIQQRDSKRAILVKQSKLLRSAPPSRLPKLPSKEEKVSCHFLELSLEEEEKKPC